jgi:DNA-binding CsgD family transcriptional regulator
MLTSLYNLTETEARLASGIAGGHSVESAAVSLHMRIATARSHLKSVFAKVGVNRQQDLVRLLSSLLTIRS